MGGGEELLDLLKRSGPDGVTNDQLKAHFGARYHELATVLNGFLASGQIFVLTDTGNPPALTYRSAQDVPSGAGPQNLTPEQLLVYQVCERSGNKGVWTRDIKTATNIPQPTLTKTLKILEQRKLIKNVRSVVSRSKKYYMLYSATPAKEITGGPWYTDQEFDHAFVEDLCKMILGIVRQGGMPDTRAILHRLLSSGVIESGVLGLEDLDSVMKVMVCDGRLEEVGGMGGGGGGGGGSTAVLLSAASSSSSSSFPPASPRYKPAKDFSSYNHLTETPCGVCPVISQCCEGGLISPSTCPYLGVDAEW